MSQNNFLNNFLTIVYILMSVPIVNVILFIPILTKFKLKEILTILLLFTFEIVLFVFMQVAPYRDGGVFAQIFYVEIIGIVVLAMQLWALKKDKKYFISSIIILVLITTINLTWKLVLDSLTSVFKPTIINATVSDYPVKNLNSIFLARWANTKNEGIYLHKLIQPYPENQKYLIYSVKNNAYGYRSLTAIRQAETLNIKITTHYTNDVGNTKYKQAFIIEAGEEPKKISLYLDGKKITPKN